MANCEISQWLGVESVRGRYSGGKSFPEFRARHEVQSGCLKDLHTRENDGTNAENRPRETSESSAAGRIIM
jgi:hypothetical protein